MDKLSKKFLITYFGEVNQNNYRIVSVEKTLHTRTCRHCGAPLNIYTGLCDLHGDPARYTSINTIRTFKRDAPIVKQAIRWLDPRLRESRTSLGDIAPKTALLVSSDEIKIDSQK